jgi:Rha family phage regulatory protein
MLTSPLPTRIDLLQGGIVTIDHQHKKVITNTLQVADHFGKRPSNVNQRIASLVKRVWLKIKPSYYLNQQGKEQKYHELNRVQFLLVVMGFTGDKADQFKADFITLFNHVEGERNYWRQQRHLASDSTKLANDNISWLQKSLAEVIPSSKRCTMLFIHVQRAIKKTATGSANTEFEDMTTCQLYRVEQLEQAVHAKIERLKTDDIAPEQIRDDVLTMIRTAKEKAPTSDETERSLDNAI